MDVPNFIYERVVDENGFFTAPWQFFINQLINGLNQNFGEEGLVMPSQPTTNIALLTNALNGAMVYDSTINQPKMNVNGTFKTIVTS